MNVRLERVIVVETSCCGKTAFSKRLSGILQQPHIELDALYWGPNWEPKPADEFRRLVDHATSGDRWIVDGNYSVIRNLIWPKGTTVIWLNYSFITVIRRALIRTFRRSLSAQELYAGNRESLGRAFFSRESIVWWTVSTFTRRQKSYREMRQRRSFPQLEWIELKRPAEAERLLRELADHPTSR